MKTEVIMHAQYYLLGEVARLLGVRSHQVCYALANGLVEEPRLKIGGKRVFLPEDVRNLARHFGVPAAKLPPPAPDSARR